MDQGDFIMGGIAAVWGGFSSFLNLAGMPFCRSARFIAFIVGIYLATVEKELTGD